MFLCGVALVVLFGGLFCVLMCDVSCLRCVRSLKMWDTQPPPIGVRGVDRGRLLDVDETGVFLPGTAKKYGYALVGSQVNLLEQYVRGVKWTVIVAVGVDGVLTFWILKGKNANSEVCFYLLYLILACVLLFVRICSCSATLIRCCCVFCAVIHPVSARMRLPATRRAHVHHDGQRKAAPHAGNLLVFV